MSKEIQEDKEKKINNNEKKAKKCLASEDTYFNLQESLKDLNYKKNFEDKKKKEEEEEIEILDFDDSIEIKKIKEVHDKQEVKSKKEKNKKKDSRNKKKLRKGEKIFLLINILVIFGIIGFYAYRTVYYYKLSHEVEGEITLRDKLTALDNLEFQNDGLYEKDKYFYYKGVNVNNYVYYSGRMYRIIDIDNGIRMIDNDTSTSLVYGVDTDYSHSNIYNWLKDYLESLKDYEVYLQENNWCNEKVDVNNYNCQKTINSYVGLLSTNDYLQAGGKNSYLNNETYFWTLNVDMDNKPLFINKEGSVNNVASTDDNYFSYGIRPVITLKDEVTIIDGDGSKNNPFIIENIGNALLKDNGVGSYVKYYGEDYRILKIEDDGVRLISNNTLDVEKNYKELVKYLNEEYIKKFPKDDLVKMNYIVNEYNFNNKYNYKDVKDNLSDYVIIPSVGDLFLNDTDGYWLNTISDSNLGLYYTVDENKMFFGDLRNNNHKVRPIIKVSHDVVASSGKGTKEEPLVIGDNNVE